MKKHLTKIFAVMAMSVMSLTVWAGDFNGTNYDKKITLPSAVDLSYGTYTGFNRDAFFSDANKIEYSQKDAAAKFTFTVSEASSFLFSLQASNGNGSGDYPCDLKVKIWADGGSEPSEPNVTFTVADDNNWNNFVSYAYATSELAAGDYYLKIIWTDQANVQNIKFSPIYAPSTTVLPLTSTDNMTAHHYGDPKNKDQAQLGYMTNNDYIEYAVRIDDAGDCIVRFQASTENTQNEKIAVSLTEVGSNMSSTPQEIAIPNGNWNTYNSYHALFSNMPAGVYLLRVSFISGTSYAPNFQHLQLLNVNNGIYTPSTTALTLTDTDFMWAYYFKQSRDKDHDPLTYMDEGNYVEYPVAITSEDDYLVTFISSVNTDNAQMSVSLTNLGSLDVTTKTVNILNRGFEQNTRYVAIFPEVAVGTYLMRVSLTSGAPNLGGIKLMSTSTYKTEISTTTTDLSSDWKTKALIEIADNKYASQTNVEYTAHNDNLNFILYNPYARKLNLSFEASTSNDDKSIVMELIDKDGTILSTSPNAISNGGWNSFNTYSASDIVSPVGYVVLRLRFEGSGNNVANVKNIQVTSQPSYVRTHAHMNLNTLCYPYQIDSYTGATFYTMSYKVVDGEGYPTDVYMEEHTGVLAAGTPYFYVPDEGETELVCYYSGDREDTPQKVNGVQGAYDDDTPVPAGSYFTYNNLLWIAGSNVTLAEYRAYVDMDAVGATPRAAAPGHRMLSIRNASAPQVTTGIENTAVKLDGSQKVIRNGQLFIIRDGKTYNAFGQTVK